MVEFLSDVWLDALAAAAAGLGETDGSIEHSSPLTIRQKVTGGPRGDVVYDLRLDRGGVTVDRSGTATPDVTFEQDHETASALVRGDTHPHVALTAGRLLISGAAHRLTAWRATLDALDDALADIRTSTTW